MSENNRGHERWAMLVINVCLTGEKNEVDGTGGGSKPEVGRGAEDGHVFGPI